MQNINLLLENKMNYKDLYVNLLAKHGSEDKPADGYYEHHHILPKALGGTDAANNLVYLSGRCHFIAHWLLFKIHKGPLMARAFYGMCDFERRAERYRPSSRVYEIAKKAFSVHNHMKEDGHRERASLNASWQWQDPEAKAKLLEGLMPMFEDPTHPMYMKGKTGAAHPRGRTIVTPLGVFGSVREAGKAHGIYHSCISRKCKSDNHLDYQYLD